MHGYRAWELQGAEQPGSGDEHGQGGAAAVAVQRHPWRQQRVGPASRSAIGGGFLVELLSVECDDHERRHPAQATVMMISQHGSDYKQAASPSTPGTPATSC
jgi:hypothetical protein